MARGCFCTVEELEVEEAISPGDFIYVPPDSNHQPVNTSADADLVLIVARNAPVEIVVDLEEAGTAGIVGEGVVRCVREPRKDDETQFDYASVGHRIKPGIVGLDG